MKTASYLFAPNKYIKGEECCFYCGLECGKEYTKKEYVKKTFTNRDIVHSPGSDYVCGCCVESLITGYETVLVDGDIKTGRGGSPRSFSWVLDGKKNKAFTKRHLDFARNVLLNPPEPPFSIVLADSGQKQLIFRAPVNHDKSVFRILLEEKVIEVSPKTLREYLEKALIVSSACGKKTLLDPDKFNNWKNVIELYGSELPLVEWLEIYSTPMGELSAWLCQGKEEALNECIISGRVPAEIGRIGGQIEESPSDGGAGNKGRGDQVLFNFT